MKDESLRTSARTLLGFLFALKKSPPGRDKTRLLLQFQLGAILLFAKICEKNKKLCQICRYRIFFTPLLLDTFFAILAITYSL